MNAVACERHDQALHAEVLFVGSHICNRPLPVSGSAQLRRFSAWSRIKRIKPGWTSSRYRPVTFRPINRENSVPTRRYSNLRGSRLTSSKKSGIDADHASGALQERCRVPGSGAAARRLGWMVGGSARVGYDS